MFRPMAITVCSAILGSLAALAHRRAGRLVLPPEGRGLASTRSRWFVRLRRYYVAHLEDAMHHRAADARGGARGRDAWPSPRSPSSAPSSCRASTRGRSSSRRASSRRSRSRSRSAISTRVEQIVRRFPEVQQVVTKIGRPDVATEAMGIYQGDVYVNLHPREEWTSGRTKEELIDAHGGGARRDAGRRLQLHPADGDAPRRGRLGREGRRGGEGLRARPGDARAAGRARSGRVLDEVRGAADLQVEVLSGRRAGRRSTSTAARIARYGLNVADVRDARRDGRRRRRRPPRSSTARGASTSSCASRTRCAATPSASGSSS